MLTGGVAMMVFLIEVPSTIVTSSEGMVIVGSVPPIPGGGEPGALFTTTTPIAPAAWQFAALTVKPQVPRLTMQILPTIAAALVNAQHPSLASAPQVAAGVVGS